eukprot:GHVN01013443.1.p1 GENE.GHVN01013443.1~~GHVN01013443.1.p1  ORF type:complete len:107 (+),score=38.58 GHVN01013443.1:89-409(+)
MLSVSPSGLTWFPATSPTWSSTTALMWWSANSHDLQSHNSRGRHLVSSPSPQTSLTSLTPLTSHLTHLIQLHSPPFQRLTQKKTNWGTNYTSLLLGWCHFHCDRLR